MSRYPRHHGAELGLGLGLGLGLRGLGLLSPFGLLFFTVLGLYRLVLALGLALRVEG